jgi:RNA polymerase sigma-70 factor (ECF subfamily)
MAEGDDARISDETLIGRMAVGDSVAFGRLVRRYQAAVFRFAQAAGAPGEDAEEVLRDTFLAARRSSVRYREEVSALPWLLALARQVSMRRQPRTERESQAGSLRELARAAGWGRHASAGPALEAAGNDRSFAAAFAALSPEDREILTLCDREYFTIDEAAHVTGLPETAVRTRLHRARLRLLAVNLGEAAGDASGEGPQIIAGLHCGEVLADLTEHLDGRSSNERSQRIDEHLLGCWRCQRFRDDIVAAVCALRELPVEPLDPQVEARLLACLGAETAAAVD